MFLFSASRSATTRKRSQNIGRKAKLVSWSLASLSWRQARSQWCCLKREML